MYQYNSNLDYYNYKNNNYNNPTYTEDANKNLLYDPYNGLMMGTMFKNLYNGYRMEKSIPLTDQNEKERLLSFLDSLNFAMIEINLYLDVNPNDSDMLKTFNQYRLESNKVKEDYENKYGPLLVNSEESAKNSWTWNSDPWPWEN